MRPSLARTKRMGSRLSEAKSSKRRRRSSASSSARERSATRLSSDSLSRMSSERSERLSIRAPTASTTRKRSGAADRRWTSEVASRKRKAPRGRSREGAGTTSAAVGRSDESGSGHDERRSRSPSPRKIGPAARSARPPGASGSTRPSSAPRPRARHAARTDSPSPVSSPARQAGRFSRTEARSSPARSTSPGSAEARRRSETRPRMVASTCRSARAWLSRLSSVSRASSSRTRRSRSGSGGAIGAGHLFGEPFGHVERKAAPAHSDEPPRHVLPEDGVGGDAVDEERGALAATSPAGDPVRHQADGRWVARRRRVRARGGHEPAIVPLKPG